MNKNKNKTSLDDDPNDTVSPILSCSLDKNLALFKSVFSNDDTIFYRAIRNTNNKDFTACLIYVDGMINDELVNTCIIRPVMESVFNTKGGDGFPGIFKEKVIVSTKVDQSNNADVITAAILSGDTVLLIDSCNEALIIGCENMKERALSEPGLEKVLRGPKAGFTESLTTNMTLLRKYLKTPDLKFKFREVGVRTRTRISLCYVESLASDAILQEVETRLDKIDIDGIFASNYIEELIKDSPLSPFKTIGNSERPDVVGAKLLEGRIAIIVDGTPSVLTLPFVFMEYFQAADDYYNNYWFSSFNRFLRCLSEFFSTSIPAIYVALTTYHQEMIPTPLLLSITASRQDIPFPTIVEALILLFIFEVIREAGIRMPTPMGQSVSIVGALILGQGAIEARLFSAPMVVIIAATGITGLITIKLKGATIIIRLSLLLLSAFLGLYGYIFGVIGAFIYLFSIRSFGVPYMIEYGSLLPEDLKDTFIRAPWWYMTTRPKQMSFKNIIRQKSPAHRERDNI